MIKIRDINKFVLSIAVCQLAGIIGSVFTAPSIPGWYAGIEKPSFNPPSWVWGPVWVSLFTLMGISLYLISSGDLRDKKVRTGLSIFSIQLILNMGWSFLFFGLHSPFYAFLDIIVLLFAILLTVYQFWKINKTAAYLLLPYLFWVIFAAVLNFYVWQMNA